MDLFVCGVGVCVLGGKFLTAEDEIALLFVSFCVYFPVVCVVTA